MANLLDHPILCSKRLEDCYQVDKSDSWSFIGVRYEAVAHPCTPCVEAQVPCILAVNKAGLRGKPLSGGNCLNCNSRNTVGDCNLSFKAYINHVRETKKPNARRNDRSMKSSTINNAQNSDEQPQVGHSGQDDDCNESVYSEVDPSPYDSDGYNQWYSGMAMGPPPSVKDEQSSISGQLATDHSEGSQSFDSTKALYDTNLDQMASKKRSKQNKPAKQAKQVKIPLGSGSQVPLLDDSYASRSDGNGNRRNITYTVPDEWKSTCAFSQPSQPPDVRTVKPWVPAPNRDADFPKLGPHLPKPPRLSERIKPPPGFDTRPDLAQGLPPGLDLPSIPQHHKAKDLPPHLTGPNSMALPVPSCPSTTGESSALSIATVKEKSSSSAARDINRMQTQPQGPAALMWKPHHAVTEPTGIPPQELQHLQHDIRAIKVKEASMHRQLHELGILSQGNGQKVSDLESRIASLEEKGGAWRKEDPLNEGNSKGADLQTRQILCLMVDGRKKNEQIRELLADSKRQGQELSEVMLQLSELRLASQNLNQQISALKDNEKKQASQIAMIQSELLEERQKTDVTISQLKSELKAERKKATQEISELKLKMAGGQTPSLPPRRIVERQRIHSFPAAPGDNFLNPPLAVPTTDLPVAHSVSSPAAEASSHDSRPINLSRLEDRMCIAEEMMAGLDDTVWRVERRVEMVEDALRHPNGEGL